MPWDKEKEKAYKKAWNERNRERKAATNKAWNERNRERKAATDKAWRERNRERIAATDKAWRKRNGERLAVQKRAWHEKNREERVAANKAWRKRNPEKTSAIGKAWRKRNHELVTEKDRRRRAKEKNAQVHLTANEKAKLLVLERTRSELQRETGIVYHIDHIIPLAHGGLHHPINLRILEGAENLSKQDKLLPEAIALAPEHFRLYSERVDPERAWEFVRQLAEGLGLSEDNLDALITGKPIKGKPTLEDFFA